MAPPVLTHTTRRGNICVFYHNGSKLFKCSTTAKVTIKDGDKNCQRIQKYVSTAYDPTKAKNPNGCCSVHRKLLLSIDNEQDSKKREKMIADLDPIVNPADFDFTFKPDRLMENERDCNCPYCNLATVSCSTEGHTYSATKPLGRPPAPEGPSPTLSPRVSVMTCQRCGRETGPGKNHPANCAVGDLLQNVTAKVNMDQKLKDLITSTNIKEKIAAARAASLSGSVEATGFAGDKESGGVSGGAGAAGIVKIATAAPGKFLTVKTMTLQNVKKQLFPKKTMNDDFQKLMVSGNSSMNQMKAVAKNIRSVHGRKSVESGIIEKLSAANKELAGFFSVIELDMDPSGGENGSEGHQSLIPGKVKRHVIYCHDIEGFTNYIKDARDHHSQTKFMLKWGMDFGQDFFKVCLNIIKEEDELVSPAQKKSASKISEKTYADVYANMFKDSGVNGLFIIAAAEK